MTPFLNSLYHGQDTYAFSNFFNQVGQGKTSDAENMLETSTYGLSQGSLFATLGNDNTFQAAPAILKQRAGYTSAVFHGNVLHQFVRQPLVQDTDGGRVPFEDFFGKSVDNVTFHRTDLLF